MNDRGLHDLSQDTVGFGRAEWNTIRDSVLRPRQLLEAYMTAGPDGAIYLVTDAGNGRLIRVAPEGS